MITKMLCRWLCRPLQEQLDALEKRIEALDLELSAAKRLCEALSSDLSEVMNGVRARAEEPERRVRIARRFSEFSEAASIARRKQGESNGVHSR